MIYPKNEMIETLMESAIDAETGELSYTEEELAEKIAAIEIEFDEKIKALRNSYLSDMLDADCIAAEAGALWKIWQETSKRAAAKKNRAERTKRFIAWLLKGEKFDKDGAKVSYTVRRNTVFDDGFIDWAKANAPEYLKEPEIRKADVTAAIKSGKQLEYVHEEPKTYINIK